MREEREGEAMTQQEQIYSVVGRLTILALATYLVVAGIGLCDMRPQDWLAVGIGLALAGLAMRRESNEAL